MLGDKAGGELDEPAADEPATAGLYTTDCGGGLNDDS